LGGAATSSKGERQDKYRGKRVRPVKRHDPCGVGRTETVKDLLRGTERAGLGRKKRGIRCIVGGEKSSREGAITKQRDM